MPCHVCVCMCMCTGSPIRRQSARTPRAKRVSPLMAIVIATAAAAWRASCPPLPPPRPRPRHRSRVPVRVRAEYPAATTTPTISVATIPKEITAPLHPTSFPERETGRRGQVGQVRSRRRRCFIVYCATTRSPHLHPTQLTYSPLVRSFHPLFVPLPPLFLPLALPYYPILSYPILRQSL